MTESERVAYAAGFLDGEGYVNEGLPVIIITQKDVAPLRFLEGYLGGKVSRRGKNSCYDLKLYGDNARLFARAVLPYVIVKKQGISLLAEQPLTLLKQKHTERMQERADLLATLTL